MNESWTMFREMDKGRTLENTFPICEMSLMTPHSSQVLVSLLLFSFVDGLGVNGGGTDIY